MSDTPRTDAVHEKMMVPDASTIDAYLEMGEHASRLERELVTVTKERDEWLACACALASALENPYLSGPEPEKAIARFRELEKGATP